MIVSERRLWNNTPTEARFYLSSLSSNGEKISGAIRSHWGIENSLHWTLDVTFCEDESRIRKQNSLENFALLRRLAINLLKQEKTSKQSLKMKRYRAAMDNNYLVQILNSASYIALRANVRTVFKCCIYTFSYSFKLFKFLSHPCF